MIVLAIPSKGRLMEATLDWFAERGLRVGRSGMDREYAAAADMDGLAVQMLSASEIAGALAEGRVHLGVTGSDLVHEGWADHAERFAQLTRMGFGQADLIVAVPAFWRDCRTLHDLDEVAAQMRAATGRRLRIATKYHRLVREHLRAAGVADYVLVDSQGATEGAVANGTADAIADITSTGETLRQNHLRVLEGEPIHRSEATLFRARHADWSDAETGALARLADRLGLGSPSRA